MAKVKKFPSELRYDLVGQDWVLIATGRARKPESFRKEIRQKKALPQSKCPFCNMASQEKPTLVFNKGKKVEGNSLAKYTTVAIPNKYPAVSYSDTLNEHTEGGLHKKMNAVGFHEVIVTKSHTKHIALLDKEQIKELIDVYQSRYLSLMNKRFVNYIAIFHNHGEEAGASQPHPHSQIITTPLAEVDLSRALKNAERFFREHGKCIYCQMSAIEQRVKQRIVFENEHFLVICPFASKVAFEMIITPKKHLSNFEKITEDEKWHLAEGFKQAFSRLYKGLKDPAYNFYLHTAPCDKKDYSFYHWHFTILPKTSTPAGFEFGTGIEISTIEPEKATDYLKKVI